MTNDNMRHMGFIDRIAAADCETLRRKEATYRGSWKRRGGVGAFMMLARKWDRLENMLQADNVGYDIFGAIELTGTTLVMDGTPLAEIRDLRQYLLLVEAEMLSRVPVPIPASATARQLADAANPTLRRVPRHDHQNDALAPWIVHRREFFEKNGVDDELARLFWVQHAPDFHVLEPHVVSSRMPRALRGYYDMRGETWTLCIGRCPPEARHQFPRLHMELNMMEHGDLPEWKKVLYAWHEDGAKFRLPEKNAAWHVEAE